MRAILASIFISIFFMSTGDVMSEPKKEPSSTRIRISGGDVEATISLRDTAASRDLLAMLPMTVTLKDHARTEKIAMLPKKLSTSGAPAGTDPSVGDFTYYAPWGNLAIFYKDFEYSSGLVSLGRVESGLESLARLKSEAQVTIESTENARR